MAAAQRERAGLPRWSVRRGSIHVRTLIGNVVELTGYSWNKTVSDLKLDIERASGIQSINQRLIFERQELADDQEASFYNILPGSMLELREESPSGYVKEVIVAEEVGCRDVEAKRKRCSEALEREHRAHQQAKRRILEQDIELCRPHSEADAVQAVSLQVLEDLVGSLDRALRSTQHQRKRRCTSMAAEVPYAMCCRESSGLVLQPCMQMSLCKGC